MLLQYQEKNNKYNSKTVLNCKKKLFEMAIYNRNECSLFSSLASPSLFLTFFNFCFRLKPSIPFFSFLCPEWLSLSWRNATLLREKTVLTIASRRVLDILSLVLCSLSAFKSIGPSFDQADLSYSFFTEVSGIGGTMDYPPWASVMAAWSFF